MCADHINNNRKRRLLPAILSECLALRSPRAPSSPTTPAEKDARSFKKRLRMLAKLDQEEEEHKRYIDKLPVPTLEQIGSIAEKQEEKEKEIEGRGTRVGADAKPDGNDATARDKAASTIQRNYRGYKTRRELSGLGLDPSTRWVEAIKEAQYRNLNTPRQRRPSEPANTSEGKARASLEAKQHWQHVSKIARHAHGEVSEPPPEEEDDEDEQHSLKDKIAQEHRKRVEKKEQERWKGKMMDLPYFLEMVDLKHRYGSNLRAYHAEWKKSDTHENFFYWLDQGEGQNVEIPNVSRQRLAKEQVRYLSREERMQYLVVIDHKGKLCWKKNGERIDTTEEYRDSVEGIVPVDSPAKTYREDEIKELDKQAKGKEEASDTQDQPSDADDAISSDDDSASSSGDSALRYPDPPGLQKASGPQKLKHVSASVILNRLLRKSTKKNTWIFTADTLMNLYVGIKQSGSFQHSSFMHGSRISAAGLIKVKRGQLRSLSPLSGHYRPPAAAFRHFVEHLKEEHTDMSRVSISKAYAVLVGLEAYIGSKKRVQEVGEKVKHGVERVVSPEKAKERHEKEKDKSQSAQLEEAKLRELEGQRSLNRVVKDVRARVWGEEGISRPASAEGPHGEGAATDSSRWSWRSSFKGIKGMDSRRASTEQSSAQTQPDVAATDPESARDAPLKALADRSVTNESSKGESILEKSEDPDISVPPDRGVTAVESNAGETSVPVLAPAQPEETLVKEDAK